MRITKPLVWRLSLLLLALLVLAEIGRQLLLAHSFYATKVPAATLGVMPAPLAGEKIVIFAPHEDDETLGCAGYIQQALAAGASVHVVLMTNGEYPEWSVLLVEKKFPRPKAYIDLGYMRQHETLASMNLLGLPENEVTFLGYPNEYLNQMWQPEHWRFANPVRSIRTNRTRSPYTNSMTKGAIYCGASLLRDVETVLLREQPDIVFTIQPNDLHRDHWPTWSFVRFALDELAASGEPFAQKCRVYTYLIHRGPDWPVPKRYDPTVGLEPPPALAALKQTDWLALPLTLAQTLQKHTAILVFRTQGARFDNFLLAFARTNELFGIVPTQRWPAARDVPSTTVILDPYADLPEPAHFPQADIGSVELGRAGHRMTVTITTRTPPGARVGFHFAIHLGGADPKDRVLAEYAWHGKKASATLLRLNTLAQLNPSELQVTVKSRATTLDAPWPIPDAPTKYFLLRAWTTLGNSTIDETAEMPFAMGKK